MVFSGRDLEHKYPVLLSAGLCLWFGSQNRCDWLFCTKSVTGYCTSFEQGISAVPEGKVRIFLK